MVDRPRKSGRLALLGLASGLALLGPTLAIGQDVPAEATARRDALIIPEVPPSPELFNPASQPIDLTTVLRLAGVENPELNRIRQTAVEAQALRQLAAAQFLPSLNAGFNYDNHTGALQQSNGNILSVNRAALYVGAGSNAVAAGTVNIPGIVLQGNTAEVIYTYLASKQLVRQRQADVIAVRNQVFLAAAVGYSDLTRAEGRLAVARQVAGEARKVANLTANYAKSQEGRPSDANRAASNLADREAEFEQAQGDVIVASARLARVLNLDPSIKFHATDAFVVPMPIVPDPTPLCELIALGLLRRPELEAQRAAVRGALLTLEGTRALPFSPSLLIGFSGGGFGGGSNLVSPTFGGFGGRSDFDAVAYWTLRNLGIGNVALIRAANARLQVQRFEQVEVLNRVRAEVAEAYARSHARFAQVATNEQAIRAGLNAFDEDFRRILARGGRDVLPIELLNSFDLLARARYSYLNAIVDYNNAQFQLFVALGQPPAASLSRPAPIDGIAPTNLPTPSGPSTTPLPAPGPGPGPFTPPPEAGASGGVAAAPAPVPAPARVARAVAARVSR